MGYLSLFNRAQTCQYLAWQVWGTSSSFPLFLVSCFLFLVLDVCVGVSLFFLPSRSPFWAGRGGLFRDFGSRVEFCFWSWHLMTSAVVAQIVFWGVLYVDLGKRIASSFRCWLGVGNQLMGQRIWNVNSHRLECPALYSAILFSCCCSNLEIYSGGD